MDRRSQHPMSSGTGLQLVLDSHRGVRDVAGKLGVDHEWLRTWANAAKRARRADLRHCLVMGRWSWPGCGATSPSSSGTGDLGERRGPTGRTGR